MRLGLGRDAPVSADSVWVTAFEPRRNRSPSPHPSSALNARHLTRCPWYDRSLSFDISCGVDLRAVSSFYVINRSVDHVKGCREERKISARTRHGFSEKSSGE